MDLLSIRNHPRLVELHFTILYDDMVRLFGVEDAMRVTESLCSAFRINFNLVANVISRRREIIAMKFENPTRFRQELVAMGLSTGMSISDVATRIFKVSRQTLYKYPEEVWNVKKFLTSEWVEELDFSVVTLGIKAYENEVFRLVQKLEAFKELM